MACSTSERLASAALAWTSPVLGAKTWPKRPDPPLTALPPMKWPISRMVAFLRILYRPGADHSAIHAILHQFLQYFSSGSRVGGPFRAFFVSRTVSLYPPLTAPV